MLSGYCVSTLPTQLLICLIFLFFAYITVWPRGLQGTLFNSQVMLLWRICCSLYPACSSACIYDLSSSIKIIIPISVQITQITNLKLKFLSLLLFYILNEYYLQLIILPHHETTTAACNNSILSILLWHSSYYLLLLI